MGIQFIQNGSNDLNYSHKLLNRMDNVGRDSVSHFAKNFLKAETVPDFFTIEIETQNRCNNDCPFCPVNRHNDTRKPKVMEENLFYTIIDQLRFMDYHGTISLFSNNEPLLDGRIFHFIEYAKKNLPQARHALYTNGLLLDKEKFSSLTKNLDLLIIDNYDDSFELIPPVRKTLETMPPHTHTHDFKCDVQISLRKKNQKLNTRAGSAPNRINEPNKFRPISPCILPFTQMIIRPDGTAAKCCNDPLNKMTLGDLNHQTLCEIWRGKAYQELRKEMYFNGRQNIPGCEFCDIFGLYNYLPAHAKPNEFKRLVEEISYRKNFGKMYILDTSSWSKNIFEKFKICGVDFDGLINIKGDAIDENYKYISFQQAVAEGAFILVPSLYYNDEFFDILHGAGYQYNRDYLIYPPELL